MPVLRRRADANVSASAANVTIAPTPIVAFTIGVPIRCPPFRRADSSSTISHFPTANAATTTAKIATSLRAPTSAMPSVAQAIAAVISVAASGGNVACATTTRNSAAAAGWTSEIGHASRPTHVVGSPRRFAPSISAIAWPTTAIAAPTASACVIATPPTWNIARDDSSSINPNAKSRIAIAQTTAPATLVPGRRATTPIAA